MILNRILLAVLPLLSPLNAAERPNIVFAIADDWGVHAGANIWASDKIAIKIQGQLLSAVQAVGGSLYFGTGGAGAGVSTYSSMLQFGIGGGLTYNLKGGAGK